MRRTIAAIAITLCTASVAHSAEFGCTGTVGQVLMYNDGRIMTLTSYRGDYTSVCSAEGTYNDVPTATCMGWYSMLMAARKESKTITIYYANVPAGVTCATVGTYGTTPPITYVMVNP